MEEEEENPCDDTTVAVMYASDSSVASGASTLISREEYYCHEEEDVEEEYYYDDYPIITQLLDRSCGWIDRVPDPKCNGQDDNEYNNNPYGRRGRGGGIAAAAARCAPSSLPNAGVVVGGCAPTNAAAAAVSCNNHNHHHNGATSLLRQSQQSKSFPTKPSYAPFSSHLYKERKRGKVGTQDRFLTKFANQHRVVLPARVNPRTGVHPRTDGGSGRSTKTLSTTTTRSTRSTMTSTTTMSGNEVQLPFPSHHHSTQEFAQLQQKIRQMVLHPNSKTSQLPRSNSSPTAHNNYNSRKPVGILRKKGKRMGRQKKKPTTATSPKMKIPWSSQFVVTEKEDEDEDEEEEEDENVGDDQQEANNVILTTQSASSIHDDALVPEFTTSEVVV